MSPPALRGILALDDFEDRARQRLPRPIFAYVSGGAETDAGVRDNRAAFAEWGFIPRTLVDVSRRDPSTSLFGRRWAQPFGIAPMGVSSLSAYRGDVVLARAAAAEDIPMAMSGSSLIRLEEVVRANPAAWFQAYLPGDEARFGPLVDRVATAGFGTLVVTVDVAVPSNRENNIRAGFSTPLRPGVRLAWDAATHPRWLFGNALRTWLAHGMPHFENSSAQRGAPILARGAERDFSGREALDWRSLAAIRRRWKGKLVVKGILDAADAQRAQEAGVDGVIVSNHGGRQLDGAVAALRVLPAIAARKQSMAVMLDGGIRRGTDVLKALALGADFVWVGRPFNYAAAVAGEAGVRHAARILADEIRRDMALVGVNALSELGPGHLMRIAPGS